MTILSLGGNLTGTLNTTTGSPTLQPIFIGSDEINFTQLNVGSVSLLGNPTLTSGSANEILLGTSLYFKNNGTLAHVGLTNDVIVNPDGTTARFFGKTYTIGASLTVTENNWNPAGIGSANVIQMSASQFLDITGIASGTNGQELVLQNVGTMPIRLVTNSGSSTEPFLFNRNAFLDPKEAITVLYDGTTLGWRPTSKYTTGDSEYYGSGIDGTVTVSSTITLQRDMYYRNLTMASGGTIFTNGWKIYVSEMFDISNAVSNCIQFAPIASLTSSGTNTAFVVGNSVGGGGAGLDAGQTGNMSSGGNGGLGGNTTGTQLQPFPIYKYSDGPFLGILGGCGGGEHPKGPSGPGGGTIWISARYINRGTNSHSNLINNPGGIGANGGGGGWTYISYGLLLGTQISNALSASGGASNVTGGAPGHGGRITLIDLTKNLATETLGTETVCQANL